MDEIEKYNFNLKCACLRLKNLKEKQGVLINGNITFHAKKSGVKVRDLRTELKKLSIIN